MTIRTLLAELALHLKAEARGLDREVTGGYVGDLMSDVLANGKEGDVWVTLQIHENVVAVASARNLAGIIVINGREPEARTLAAAEREGVPIMVSDLSSFELVGKLHALGVGGKR